MANPFIFLAILLGFTAFLLVLIKYGRKNLIAWVIGISIFLTFGYIFAAMVPMVMGAGYAEIAVMAALAVAATVLCLQIARSGTSSTPSGSSSRPAWPRSSAFRWARSRSSCFS